MKVKKIAGVTLVIVTALAILLLCVFLFWLGPTVKLVAEKVGSKALGAPLTINELSINPRNGTLHLSDFKIANQEAFGRSYVVSLSSLDIAMDMGSIFSQTVVVHRVELNSPYFTYEQSSATDNLTEFLLNIQEFVGYDPSAPPPPPDPKKLAKKQKKKEKKAQNKKEKGPKIVIVESLVINEVQGHLANTDDPRLDMNVGFEQLSVSMTNGTVNLRNLHVGNPALLDTPTLFTLDAIDIVLEPESLYSGTVFIHDLQVIRPYAYLEHNPQTDTVAEFMKIAATFTATSTNTSIEPAPDMPAEAEPEVTADRPPPVALRNLLVDDIQIKLLDTTATNASFEPRMLAGIGSISANLVDGSIQLKEMTIPNPAGFVASNLFHLANIDITLEPGSIFAPQTVIQEVFVNAPTIYLEQTETSGNASELKDTLMGFVPPVSETEGAPTPKEPAMSGEGPKPIPLSEQAVVLQMLIVTNFTMNLSLPAETNAPASDSFHLPTLDGTMDKISLRKLNPLRKKEDQTTNGTTVVETSVDGPMKLIAFKTLIARPLDGTIRMTHLQVSNPKGFANEHLVTVELFRMDIDTDSLQLDTLLIRDILIDKPRISYERKITTDNIKVLQTEIEKAIARRKNYTGQEEPPPEMQSQAGETEAQKVIIEHLLVNGGRVRAKLSALPSAPIPLPNIEMTDMGKAEGGTSLGEAASNLWVAFYDAIIGSVSSATGFAGDALKGAGALTFGTLGSVTGRTSGNVADEEGMDAEGEASQTTAEPAEEKKSNRRLFRRRSGRFF